MARAISESDLEQAMMAWLAELGWQTGYGPNVSDGVERASVRDTVLQARLAAALARLNPDVPESARADALRRLCRPNLPGQAAANRHIHRLMVEGVPVEYRHGQETRGRPLTVVDWQHPGNNDWRALNQFTVRGPHRSRRADIVLFLNGLPIAVIELKNPADADAGVTGAVNQLQAYKTDLPDLFHANALLIASDGIEARFGSLTAQIERFMAWRTIDGVALDPFGPLREAETLVRGLLAPTLLLDYLRHFVLFEEAEQETMKKIAGYHQFHAVRAVVQSVLTAAAPGGSRKGGVVWHTQGAGKSIEMTCLAGKLMQHPQMGNPTLLVVTDRNDLDGQLFQTFAGAAELLRETPVQADSRAELRALLANRPSGGIIFTTIQKFTPNDDETAFPCLSTRENIVVICDEAHRTQYGLKARLRKPKPLPDQAWPLPGTPELKVAQTRAPYLVTPLAERSLIRYGYAWQLRHALPHATFVAFTGTPVELGDRDTRAVFGDYVHIYDVEQAQTDKATVPIYYEGRLVPLSLAEDDTAQLDAELDELTEDEESEQARTEQFRRWAVLEKLVGAPSRIERVAADLVAHFEGRQTVLDGKAMMVAMSRQVCVFLYDAICRLRPEWADPDPERGVIKIVMTGSGADSPALQAHVYPPKVKKRLEARFKDPTDPLKLVIVRDMWLTGFDAPCLHTMYVDKPMKGHSLMQAITRVNRVFRDKPGGVVVDYIGIANELKSALAEYTGAAGGGRPVVDAAEALAVLQDKLAVLHAMLHDCDYADFRSHAWARLPEVADFVLALDDGKQRFADTVLAAGQAFALCSTLPGAAAMAEELAFLQAVKVALGKLGGSGRRLDDAQKEHALRQIMSRAVISDEVIDIFKAAGLNRPNIGILSEAFLDEVRRLPQRNLAVALLERLLRDEIRAKFKTNVVQLARFSALLQQSLIRYRNRAVETAQVIEELIDMAREFGKAAAHGERLGLTPEETAFYDALAANPAALREMGDQVLKTIAMELTRRLRASVTVDWAVRETVRAKLRVMVKTLLKRYKYPPDKQEEATETVLKQAEQLSAVWTLDGP